MKTTRIRNLQIDAASTQKAQPESPSIRFWENYLVRYLLGSVAGAAMVWVLLWQIPHHVDKPSLFEPVNGADNNFLLILGLVGFAYCYLSSQLVLVFHYARWVSAPTAVPASSLGFRHAFRGFRTVAVCCLIFTILVLGAAILLVEFKLAHISLAQFSALEFGMLPVAVQWGLMIEVHRRLPAFCSFYERLSTARSRRSSSDFVESYRHLREHGNALFIVLAEVLFFFYAYAALALAFPARQSATPTQETQLLIAAAFLVLWLIPGAYAWFLGTHLEQRLIQQGRTNP